DISNKKGIPLEYLDPLADSSLTENKEKNQKEDSSRIEMDSISIVQ
ncbi:39001_t:CDS:1, partial [Gigaspora margarita]